MVDVGDTVGFRLEGGPAKGEWRSAEVRGVSGDPPRADLLVTVAEGEDPAGSEATAIEKYAVPYGEAYGCWSDSPSEGDGDIPAEPAPAPDVEPSTPDPVPV